MNQCQACHEREAVVRLTQIVGDDVTTLHLCSKCAAERGIETDTAIAQTPLGAFLAAMDKNGAAPSTNPPASTEPCASCGATLEDFRASGRVGCAGCWVAFDRPLRDLLRRLHGATRHTGKGYRRAGAEPLTPAEVRRRNRSELREELRVAIEDEHFERAAELRDQLRVLDGDD